MSDLQVVSPFLQCGARFVHLHERITLTGLRRATSALGCALVCAAVSAAPASAGSQVVTGEDEHCSTGATSPSICDTTYKYVQYARGEAPDPSKGLLALNCDTSAAPQFLQGAYEGRGSAPEITTICPDDAAFDEVALTTDDFSAITVSYGLDLTRVNARAADFKAFFDQGGGIATFDTAENPEDYDFLPLPVALDPDDGLSDPYSVTEDGAADLGITDEELNSDCCMHEAYAEPAADSKLKVGVRDDEGRPGVLYGRVPRPQPEKLEEPKPPVQQQQQASSNTTPPLPDPLSGTSLTPGGTATVSRAGVVTVPGMTETCGVGPCTSYERLFDVRGRAAAHDQHKRHGLLATDLDTLMSGQRQPVRVRLDRQASKRLRRRGRMRVEALVTVRDARGRAQLARKTFTLRGR